MYVGIDAGASATKSVIISKEGEIVSYSIVPSGINFKVSSEKSLRKALKMSDLSLKGILYAVSTGYGRA